MSLASRKSYVCTIKPNVLKEMEFDRELLVSLLHFWKKFERRLVGIPNIDVNSYKCAHKLAINTAILPYICFLSTSFDLSWAGGPKVSEHSVR